MADPKIRQTLCASYECAKKFQDAGAAREVQIYDHSRVNSKTGTVDGAVYIFHPEDQVRADSPLLSHPERLFGVASIARIESGCPDETVIRRLMPTLSERVHLSSSKRFTLLGAEKGYDSSSWLEQLGARGFIGVHKADQISKVPSYYLVVYTDSDYVGRELVDKFVTPQVGVITYGALLRSAPYRNAERYAERNAQRLLVLAAETLGLKIHVRDDGNAFLNAASFDAPPDLAVPHSQALYNSLHQVGTSAVPKIGFFSRTCHLPSCKGDGVPYLVDPCHGIHLYHKDPKCPQGAWSNKLHCAFPVGIGRYQDAITNSQYLKEQRARAARDRHVVDFMDQVVHWHGRKGSAVHHDRLFVYNDYIEGRQNMHRDTLGAKHGSIRLSPVGLILPPPVC